MRNSNVRDFWIENITLRAIVKSLIFLSACVLLTNWLTPLKWLSTNRELFEIVCFVFINWLVNFIPSWVSGATRPTSPPKSRLNIDILASFPITVSVVSICVGGSDLIDMWFNSSSYNTESLSFHMRFFIALALIVFAFASLFYYSKIQEDKGSYNSNDIYIVDCYVQNIVLFCAFLCYFSKLLGITTKI
ncbi:MAG: hypothetical protein AAGE59_21630 [Cyanobacteria bacterium P01_F01_bin.86]